MTSIKSDESSVLDFQSTLEAALFFYKAGFPVIPLVPGTKQTAVKWDPWLGDLTEKSIREYWQKHPKHELGFIVPEGLAVFDADSATAVAAVYQLEESFDITPDFVVKTRRGEHHYFRLFQGTKIKTCSMDTAKFHHGIDIKAERSMVALPGSANKSVEKYDIEHINDLSVIGQDVVDAVYRHNGKTPPSSTALIMVPRSHSARSTATGQQLAGLVNALDPDIGHDQWLHVAMALSQETGNSDEGYQIFDDWSSKGSKYKGPADTRSVWRSLAKEPANPITIATLKKLVNDAGANAHEIVIELRDRFTKVPFEIINPEIVPSTATPSVKAPHPLDRFSLTGSSAVLEKRRQKEVFVLAGIALLGQATALYASPNCGKTLAVISLLTDAIAEGRIDPKSVYFMNADDNLRGLIEKVKIAEEFGFHMIGEGYKNFRAEDLLDLLQQMIDNNTAAGSIVILDTAKRFTDLMNKKVVSTFTAMNRRFVSQGGTVIALAHVNKKRADDGRSVYAGTSDIIDDFDCAYVIELMDDGAISGKRVIAFENRKARGSVVPKAFFTYMSPDCVNGYMELLESFCHIDSAEANQAVAAAQVDADAPMIAVIKAVIQAGPAAKKDLIAALREQSGMSRNAASSLIDRYCGDDTTTHLWRFERGARGAHRYELHHAVNPIESDGGAENA